MPQGVCGGIVRLLVDDFTSKRDIPHIAGVLQNAPTALHEDIKIGYTNNIGVPDFVFVELTCLFYPFANGFQPCALSSNSAPSRVTSTLPSSGLLMRPMMVTPSMAATLSWSVSGTVKRSS